MGNIVKLWNLSIWGKCYATFQFKLSNIKAIHPFIDDLLIFDDI
jgi:hypothetical protein